MDVTDAFVDLVTRSHEYLTARQDALRDEFGVGRWKRWHWDQDTGLLVFFDDSVARVVAEVQFVGSVSTISRTWLWAWANPTIDQALTRGLAEVRALGEEQGIPQLTTAKWDANETDGWEMTSITAYVLQAKGGYRTPDDHGFLYMVMSSIAWAQ